MLAPVKLNPLPGLLLAALPPLAVGLFGLAFLSFVGGRAEVWRMAGAAGPYSLLMLGAVLAVTLVLSGLLCRELSGRRAPLVVLVGLAMLPWFLGIAGTQEAMERVVAALPHVVNPQGLAVLVAGTGEAMVTRLLGAWTSAALLVAVALGLVLLGLEAAFEGEDAGELLGAALGLALGGIALLVALEAYHLFELLTTLATQAPEARTQLIATSAENLTHLRELRATALGALAVLALALVCWQCLLRPEAVSQWAGNLLLAALAAAVLMLDARPLQLAARGIQEAGLSRTLLPMLVQNGPSNQLGAVPTARLPVLDIRISW